MSTATATKADKLLAGPLRLDVLGPAPSTRHAVALGRLRAHGSSDQLVPAGLFDELDEAREKHLAARGHLAALVDQERLYRAEDRARQADIERAAAARQDSPPDQRTSREERQEVGGRSRRAAPACRPPAPCGQPRSAAAACGPWRPCGRSPSAPAGCGWRRPCGRWPWRRRWWSWPWCAWRRAWRAWSVVLSVGLAGGSGYAIIVGFCRPFPESTPPDKPARHVRRRPQRVHQGQRDGMRPPTSSAAAMSSAGLAGR
jgi:hypothetical protein